MPLLSSTVFTPLMRTVSRARASKATWVLNWRLLLALIANLLAWGGLIWFFAIR
jgi:hypothetical protein